MATQAEVYGGSVAFSLTADLQISRQRAWNYQITADAAGRAVKLPDARYLIPGYPVIQIVNEGTDTFAVQDADGTELIATASVPQNTVLTFALIDNSTAAGDWEWGSWTQGAAAGPAATIYPWTIGGLDSGMFKNAWRFDFIGDSWSEPGGASTAQHQYSAGFQISGIAYVQAVSDLDKYDPTSWTVSTLTSKSTSGKDCGGAHYTTDDKGACFGGQSIGQGFDADSYDESGDAWTSLTAMSTRLRKTSAQPITSNLILYHGGNANFAGSSPGITVTRTYNISGDSHATKTASTFTRQYFGSAIDTNGDYWAYGGFTSNIAVRDEVEKYDVSGDSWSTASNVLPNGAHGGGGATSLAVNGYSYVVGGDGASNPDATYQHIPATDAYSAMTDHPGAATARGISCGGTMAVTD